MRNWSSRILMRRGALTDEWIYSYKLKDQSIALPVDERRYLLIQKRQSNPVGGGIRAWLSLDEFHVAHCHYGRGLPACPCPARQPVLHVGLHQRHQQHAAPASEERV